MDTEKEGMLRAAIALLRANWKQVIIVVLSMMLLEGRQK